MKKPRGGGGILPILERPQTKRIRGSSANLRTLNACALSFLSPPPRCQLSTVDCRLPFPLRYTIGSIVGGENRMPTREDAWKLLCEYTASESLRKHMLAEASMCLRKLS